MHINVHTLTHIYMRGDEREHIYIYQVIHHVYYQLFDSKMADGDQL